MLLCTSRRTRFCLIVWLDDDYFHSSLWRLLSASEISLNWDKLSNKTLTWFSGKTSAKASREDFGKLGDSLAKADCRSATITHPAFSRSANRHIIIALMSFSRSRRLIASNLFEELFSASSTSASSVSFCMLARKSSLPSVLYAYIAAIRFTSATSPSFCKSKLLKTSVDCSFERSKI